MQELTKAWRKWAIVFLGAYLFGSPWIFGVFEKASSANAWVVGACLVVAALRVPVVSGPLAAELIRVQLGVWLLISPFALGFSGSVSPWNAWVVGVLTIGFADFPSLAFALVVLACSLRREYLRYRTLRLSPQKIIGYTGPEEPASPGQLCWHIVERSHQIHETMRRNPSEAQVEACILGHAACMHDLSSLIEHIADHLPKSGPLRQRRLWLARWAATCSIRRAAEAFPEAVGVWQRSGSK